MDEPTVSLFANPRHQTPQGDITLPELYEHIRSGTWAEPVEAVRKARQALDTNTDTSANETLDKAWRDAKGKLPAVSLSCLGETRAKSVPLTERGLVASGRLQVDLDLHGEDDSKRERLKTTLLTSPYLEALFISPSGDGWKGVLCVDGAGDIERHQRAVVAAEAHLQDLLGLGNDSAVKDVQRLCYVSHDPKLVYRPDATVLRPDDDDWVVWAERVTGPTPKPPLSAAATVPEAAPSDKGTILPGHRYTTLLRYAGWFRRCGMERDEIEASLGAVNDRRCQPPLPREEIQQLAEGIVGYEPDQMTQATVENWAATTLGNGERRMAISCFTDTEEREPEWLWRGYLLRGATAVVGGRQGTSKGLFTMDLAARLTRGDRLPDGTDGPAPTNVLIVSREDDASLALKPRLRVAGADMARVFWSYGDFTDATPIPTMAEAAQHIAREVDERDIGLVVIDPLGAWVEDDGNNGQQIRAVIDPMNHLVRQTGCAVLFVAHLRKAAADNPMDAFAGSVQVTAACRTAMVITAAPDCHERLLQVVKTNFRPPDRAMVYRLRQSGDLLTDPPSLEWRVAGSAELPAPSGKAGSMIAVPVATVLEHLPEEHRPLREVARWIRGILCDDIRGLSVQAVTDALLEAVVNGDAFEGEGPRGTRTIGRAPAVRHVSATDRAVLYWEAHPQASVRAVAEAVGCGVGTASRAKGLADVPRVAGSGVPSVHSDDGSWNEGPTYRDVPTPISPPPLGGGEGDGTAMERQVGEEKRVPSPAEQASVQVSGSTNQEIPHA